MRFGLKWILNRQRIILYWRMDGQQSRCNELIPREKILKGVSLHLKKNNQCNICSFAISMTL